MSDAKLQRYDFRFRTGDDVQRTLGLMDPVTLQPIRDLTGLTPSMSIWSSYQDRIDGNDPLILLTLGDGFTVSGSVFNLLITKAKTGTIIVTGTPPPGEVVPRDALPYDLVLVNADNTAVHQLNGLCYVSLGLT